MPPVDRTNPQRAKSSDSRYSLMEFMRDFPDDATCLEWLWRNRYSEDGEHAECPKCERTRSFKRYATKQRRQSWTCTACGHHIQPTAGTIFHNSSTSLHLWFFATHLMTSTKCGVSAKHLERELGVTYKTAWRMLNKIRNDLMAQDDALTLSGEVEVDETYYGGRQRGQVGRPGRQSKKTPVLAMTERDGKVVAHVVPDASRKALLPPMERHIERGATVYTDDYPGYRGQLGERGFVHRVIMHSRRHYVSGVIHTSTVEGFFGNVKNGIAGNYHGVSRKWLQGYLNEYAWRLNHRDEPRADFLTLLLRSARS